MKASKAPAATGIDGPGLSGSAPRVAGSKGAAGAWQRIVSLLPAHRLFVEAFAGGAAVTRHKKPAAETWLYEIDPDTARQLAAAMRDRAHVFNADALAALEPRSLPADAVLYCDPPYVMSARRSQQPCYRFDWNDADHVRFLAWVKRASCPVIVSGYWSELYARELATWRHSSFTVGTRRGRATEHVWCNFPESAALHDAAHVGNGFTERQRIKRKAARWVRMLNEMQPAERAAVLEAIAAAQTPASIGAAKLAPVPRRR